MMPARVAVFGAGTMGSGIAQVVATAGLPVDVIDVKPTFLEKSKGAVAASLDRIVKKGSLSATDKELILSRISWSSSFDLVPSVAIVIEAVPEDVSIKRGIIELVSSRYPDIILASNTSSVSLSLLASFSSRPENVVGLHFFNPAPVMKLVEVIRAMQTSDATLNTALSFVEGLGKTPICVANKPGFAVNRILLVMLNEAFFAYSEGVASAEDIDKAMQLGCNHPIGPLALADMIGLDVCLDVCNQFYEQFGDPKYRPCPLLREMVEAGFFGRKSGRGFHRY